MAIWSENLTVGQLNERMPESMLTQLGIRFSDIGTDYLSATMPVDWRTKQPAGLLHGGASVALAETLGSVAAGMVNGFNNGLCVGLEINANHIRPMREGMVTGTARAIHLGRKTQVWEIRICDDDDRLVCISRLTVAVLPGKTQDDR